MRLGSCFRLCIIYISSQNTLLDKKLRKNLCEYLHKRIDKTKNFSIFWLKLEIDGSRLAKYVL